MGLSVAWIMPWYGWVPMLVVGLLGFGWALGGLWFGGDD
jgi:hypothetical protein